VECLEDRRLLSFGDLDASFGVEGRVATDFFGAGQDQVNALALQADGKIVAVGTSTSEAVLARYTSGGTLDAGFGTGGTARTWLDDGKGVVLQPDGKILVGGSIKGTTWDMGVVRYNADGTLDHSFGAGGISIVDFGGDDRAYGIALQTGGQILIAGVKSLSSNSSDIALARLHSDGTLDATFGTGGLVTTDLGNNEHGSGVAVDTSGRIVVAVSAGAPTRTCASAGTCPAGNSTRPSAAAGLPSRTSAVTNTLTRWPCRRTAGSSWREGGLPRPVQPEWRVGQQLRQRRQGDHGVRL
jgi:uncharacterized delta-60 repeat protein